MPVLQRMCVRGWTPCDTSGMSAPVARGGTEAAGELRGKSLGELAEILERQEKLLSNKKLIAKLPDRGKKDFRLR
ncbi:unnamed protein product [Ranitomeya imitator]|uniref:Uncharacterized protein n=1 Tax=Ranitomeya imitator TaxID=111125 RepID=A0ABN9LJ75_9NEOB|nr:unnamed protein product [Ranitomeya imitator]